MSQTTTLTFFEQSVASLLRSYILPAISSGIQQRGAIISVDELAAMLQLPIQVTQSSSATVPTHGMPSIPGFLSGTGSKGISTTSTSSTGITSSRRSSTKKKEEGPVDPKDQCKYIFSRGKDGKKGTKCVEAAFEFGFCKSCLKKKTVQDAIVKGGGINNQMGAPNIGVQNSYQASNKTSKPYELEVEEIDNEEGLYKDKKYGFIVRAMPDGTILAIAIESDGPRRPLNSNEKKIATDMSLAVLEDTVQPNPIQIPLISSVQMQQQPQVQMQQQPQVPVQQMQMQQPQVQMQQPQVQMQQPQMPQIPQVPVQQMQMPQVPQIQQMQQMQLPSQNLIPQIPQIPIQTQN